MREMKVGEDIAPLEAVAVGARVASYVGCGVVRSVCRIERYPICGRTPSRQTPVYDRTS